MERVFYEAVRRGGSQSRGRKRGKIRGWRAEDRKRGKEEGSVEIKERESDGGGLVVAAFVDLKAAFDSVDRGILLEALKSRGVREGLRDRIEEVYRETRSRVRVDEGVGKNFWTERGVRQGCPMSPYLFNLVLAEEMLERVGWGGIRLGRDKEG